MIAEDEVAFDMPGQTVIGVPSGIVPKVHQLIAEHKKSQSEPEQQRHLTNMVRLLMGVTFRSVSGVSDLLHLMDGPLPPIAQYAPHPVTPGITETIGCLLVSSAAEDEPEIFAHGRRGWNIIRIIDQRHCFTAGDPLEPIADRSRWFRRSVAQ